MGTAGFVSPAALPPHFWQPPQSAGSEWTCPWSKESAWAKAGPPFPGISQTGTGWRSPPLCYELVRMWLWKLLAVISWNLERVYLWWGKNRLVCRENPVDIRSFASHPSWGHFVCPCSCHMWMTWVTHPHVWAYPRVGSFWVASLLLRFRELCELVVKQLKLDISPGRSIDSTATGEFLAQGNSANQSFPPPLPIVKHLPAHHFPSSWVRSKKRGMKGKGMTGYGDSSPSLQLSSEFFWRWIGTLTLLVLSTSVISFLGMVSEDTLQKQGGGLCTDLLSAALFRIGKRKLWNPHKRLTIGEWLSKSLCMNSV